MNRAALEFVRGPVAGPVNVRLSSTWPNDCTNIMKGYRNALKLIAFRFRNRATTGHLTPSITVEAQY